jgi:hypothetical protein
MGKREVSNLRFFFFKKNIYMTWQGGRWVDWGKPESLPHNFLMH